MILANGPDRLISLAALYHHNVWVFSRWAAYNKPIRRPTRMLKEHVKIITFRLPCPSNYKLLAYSCLPPLGACGIGLPASSISPFFLIIRRLSCSGSSSGIGARYESKYESAQVKYWP